MKKETILLCFVSGFLSQGSEGFAETIGVCPQVYETNPIEKSSGKLDFFMAQGGFEEGIKFEKAAFKRAEVNKGDRLITCRYSGGNYIWAKIPEVYDANTCTVGGKIECEGQSQDDCKIECDMSQ